MNQLLGKNQDRRQEERGDEKIIKTSQEERGEEKSTKTRQEERGDGERQGFLHQRFLKLEIEQKYANETGGDG